MKKILCMLIAACCLLVACTACDSAPKDDSPYLKLIGKSSDDVFSSLEVKKEDAKETGDQTGMFELPDTVKYLEKDFTVRLTFDKEDKLMGYSYLLQYPSDQLETAVKDMQDIIDGLKKSYGDPDTYEGTTNRFSEQENPVSALPAKTSLVESWNIDSSGAPENFVLNAQIVSAGENGVMISLEYRIQQTP